VYLPLIRRAMLRGQPGIGLESEAASSASGTSVELGGDGGSGAKYRYGSGASGYGLKHVAFERLAALLLDGGPLPPDPVQAGIGPGLSPFARRFQAEARQRAEVAKNGTTSGSGQPAMSTRGNMRA